MVTQTIFKLVIAFTKDPYLDPVNVFKSIFDRVEVRPCKLESHYQYIKRIIVTPSRTIFIPPEPIAINRILRQHIFYVENFARVCFRDEDFSPFNVHSEQGTINVRRVINDGVKISDDIVFQFLGCSNSQLRSQGLWLFYPQCPVTVESIRESVGDLNKMKTTQKYVTRMGLAFTATDFSLSDNIEIEEIPEVERIVGDKRFIFSDGVGRISPVVRDSIIKEKYGENHRAQNQPVAFQVRVGGCKGMVAVDPSLGNRPVLQIRPSMKKFESHHKQIEPCGYSGPRELYMNRQVIAILRAQGVPDNNFITLQNRSLLELADMLTMERLAAYEMGTKLRVKTSDLEKSGIRITTEPFLRRQLVSLYKFKIRDAIAKTRFRIDHDKGRQMKGIMDETHTLNYGEIFVQYTDLSNYCSANNKKILEGDVFITKNPCLHPGDLKKVQAVDIPALHHLYDVIVFPAKGQRPHPNELSGSDLDGDEYFVCWEESLMPRRDCEPADFYIEIIKQPSDVEEPPLAITETQINEFVFNYITKGSKLGQISNAHAIWADRKEEGVISAICKKLANKHSDAVDFIKTGIAPVFDFSERSLIYPDWMMKPDKAAYCSKTAIGKMFHVVEGLEHAILHLNICETDIKQDKIFLLDEPPSHDEINNATKIYKKYCNELSNIMVAYGILDEGDIAAGCLNTLKMSLAKEHERNYDMREQCLSMFRSLQKKYRKIFFEKVGVSQDSWRHEEEKVLRQAAAWYWVTYKRNPERHQGLILLSFPWCVASILIKIPELMNNNSTPSVRSQLRNELKNWYAEKSVIEMAKREKGLEVEKLLSVVGETVVDISRHTYGLLPGNSFMYFVKQIPFTFAQKYRKGIFVENIQNLSEEDKGQLDQMTDDFSKSSGNWAVSEVEIDSSTVMKVILTSDDMFLRKVTAIKSYCDKYEILGHTMYLIVNWAERNGITSGEDADLGLSFIEFMLQNESSQIFPIVEPGIPPREVVIGHYPHKNTATLYLEYLKWVIRNCFKLERSVLDEELLDDAYELLSTEKCIIAAMREYHFVSYSLTFESTESFKQLSIIRKKDKKMCFNIARATSFCAQFFNDPKTFSIVGKDSKIEIKIRETELGGVDSLVLEIWGDNPQKMNEIADAFEIDENKFKQFGNYLFVQDSNYNQINFVAPIEIDRPMKKYFHIHKHEQKSREKNLVHNIIPLYYDNDLKELVNSEILRKIRLMRDGLYNQVSHGNLEVNTTFGRLKVRRCENGSLDKEHISVNKDNKVAILKKLRGITKCTNKDTLYYVFKILYEGIYYRLIFDKDYKPVSLSLEDIIWTDMMIVNNRGVDLNLMMTSTHQLDGDQLNHLPLTYDLKHGAKWIERVDKEKGIQLAGLEIPCFIICIQVVTEKRYKFIKDPALEKMSFCELSVDVYKTMDKGFVKYSKSYMQLKLCSKINTLTHSELIRNYQKVALDLAMVDKKVSGVWKSNPQLNARNQVDSSNDGSTSSPRPPRRPHNSGDRGATVGPLPTSNVTEPQSQQINDAQLSNVTSIPDEPSLSRSSTSTSTYNSSIPPSTSNSVIRLARSCRIRNIRDVGDREEFDVDIKNGIVCHENDTESTSILGLDQTPNNFTSNFPNIFPSNGVSPTSFLPSTNETPDHAASNNQPLAEIESPLYRPFMMNVSNSNVTNEANPPNPSSRLNSEPECNFFTKDPPSSANHTDGNNIPDLMISGKTNTPVLDRDLETGETNTPFLDQDLETGEPYTQILDQALATGETYTLFLDRDHETEETHTLFLDQDPETGGRPATLSEQEDWPLPVVFDNNAPSDDAMSSGSDIQVVSQLTTEYDDNPLEKEILASED